MEINIIYILLSLLIINVSVSYQKRKKFFIRIKKISLVSLLSIITTLLYITAIILKIYQQNINITYNLIMIGNYIFIFGAGILFIIEELYFRYKKHKK